MNARRKESGILVSEEEEEELPIGRGWFVSISLVMLNARLERKEENVFSCVTIGEKRRGTPVSQKENKFKNGFF